MCNILQRIYKDFFKKFRSFEKTQKKTTKCCNRVEFLKPSCMCHFFPLMCCKRSAMYMVHAKLKKPRNPPGLELALADVQVYMLAIKRRIQGTDFRHLLNWSVGFLAARLSRVGQAVPTSDTVLSSWLGWPWARWTLGWCITAIPMMTLVCLVHLVGSGPLDNPTGLLS